MHILLAAHLTRKRAQGNIDKLRLMLVESKAYTVVGIEAERLAGVLRAHDVNEHLSEVGVDAPVVRASLASASVDAEGWP